MPKCCFENFPSLKSSKARLIILNISFKIQLYRPNKHLYDTLVTTSSLQCKNILKNFVVDEKTAKIQQQEKSRSLSTFAEKHARASPFPHHTSNSATSARFTALYISALVCIYTGEIDGQTYITRSLTYFWWSLVIRTRSCGEDIGHLADPRIHSNAILCCQGKATFHT